jgi:phosphoserine/homoserine phosphotransferase
LDANGLTIDDITDVIEEMQPLEGAIEFLDHLRSKWQVIILSDTFSQFAGPMMDKLGRPTLLCHTLEIDEESRRITGWTIRLEDQKRRAVEALRGMNFNVIAAGDSYNDTSMLAMANAGILINPPSNVIDEFPQFLVATDYAGLLAAIEAAASDIGE